MSRITKHDKKVKKIAAGYKSQGYNVKADINGYEQPPNFYRHRPDVFAAKGRNKVMVEVETKSSMSRDKDQRKILKKYAKKKNIRFRKVMA